MDPSSNFHLPLSPPSDASMSSDDSPRTVSHPLRDKGLTDTGKSRCTEPLTGYLPTYRLGLTDEHTVEGLGRSPGGQP